MTYKDTHQTGAGQARAARMENKNVHVDETGKPLLSAEEARILRMMESANDKAKVDKMRREAAERWREERKFTH